MRYWDASALVPLVLDEEGTALARGWLSDDATIVTWGLSRVEIVSAVEREARAGRLEARERRAVLAAFRELYAAWREVIDVVAVRSRAQALLARHAIRAADAAQLGAALLVAEDEPASLTFVCLDRCLADAAEREGFALVTWPDDPRGE